MDLIVVTLGFELGPRRFCFGVPVKLLCHMALGCPITIMPQLLTTELKNAHFNSFFYSENSATVSTQAEVPASILVQKQVVFSHLDFKIVFLSRRALLG